MRHIILVLIALIALSGFVPASMAAPAPVKLVDKLSGMADPAEESLLTTPTMASFLNDSWLPSTFVAPVEVATDRQKNGTLKNSTYDIYDFLNGGKPQPKATSPIYTASAATKDKGIAWTGESIYQFLDPIWKPTATVEVYTENVFKMHQMN
jgi:hypothetical protein